MHDFVSGLSDPVRAEFESLCTETLYPRGAVIYANGDAPRAMYRLVEGAIKLCNFTIDGNEVLAGEFRPGDCFGEMSLVDGLPRNSNTIAVAECRVAVLSFQDFNLLRKKHREFGDQLMFMLCLRLRYMHAYAEEALGFPLRVRLARILHRLAYTHGTPVPAADTLSVEISHEDLGKMTGSTRQSVSRELKSLEQEGVIELSYGRVVIADMQNLAERYEAATGVEQLAPAYGSAKFSES